MKNEKLTKNKLSSNKLDDSFLDDSFVDDPIDLKNPLYKKIPEEFADRSKFIGYRNWYTINIFQIYVRGILLFGRVDIPSDPAIGTSMASSILLACSVTMMISANSLMNSMPHL